jgi:hypothetical protein
MVTVSGPTLGCQTSALNSNHYNAKPANWGSVGLTCAHQCALRGVLVHSARIYRRCEHCSVTPRGQRASNPAPAARHGTQRGKASLVRHVMGAPAKLGRRSSIATLPADTGVGQVDTRKHAAAQHDQQISTRRRPPQRTFKSALLRSSCHPHSSLAADCAGDGALRVPQPQAPALRSKIAAPVWSVTTRTGALRRTAPGRRDLHATKRLDGSAASSF